MKETLTDKFSVQRYIEKGILKKDDVAPYGVPSSAVTRWVGGKKKFTSFFIKIEK